MAQPEILDSNDGLQVRKNALKQLGQRLLADGLIYEEQLALALERQRLTGEFLGEAIVSLGFQSSARMGGYLEKLIGFPFVDIANHTVDSNAARKIPQSMIGAKHVLAFKEEGGALYVAMADPLNLSLVDELRSLYKGNIVSCLAWRSDIADAAKRIFEVRSRAQEVLDRMNSDGSESIEALAGMAKEAPIVRLVEGILSSAVSAGASDLHIEPQESCVRVRFRIDGILYEHMTIPLEHLPASISRIKILSSLDIAERRRPQDGRFSTQDDKGNDYEVRLSVMPTVYGEKACMRLLAQRSSSVSLDSLGFFPEQKEIFEGFLRRGHGILLVTGPTGSGKTTSLYAALHHINDSKLNINTIEDPVEYRLEGVNQVQVNPKIGVTFANGLRTLVRQDPDVILVGEIRDAETAEIAIQAALTGHLVLSTLHTNDAPGALVRLQNMGVEPFLISSAVIGVVGQRLVRTVCPTCKVLSEASPELVAALDLQWSEAKPPQVAHGKGCSRCRGRGMLGRTAVHEVMKMSDSIRKLTLSSAPSEEIYGCAVREGMTTMRAAGIRKILDLTVSPEEIARVLAPEE